MAKFTESEVEEAALEWLESIGWRVVHGPDIAPQVPGAERDDYGAVVLESRLREALARLNPDLPSAALDDAFRKLIRPEGATLEARNRAFHRLIVDGATVEYRDDSGAIRGTQVCAVDFDHPDSNDWLAVNQFTVVENRHERRPDIVLFVNGLPFGLIELKNPADEDATVWTAWQQLQTYKAKLPSLFAFNAALIVSDGVEARIGTLTAGREWFKPWRTISGEALADPNLPQLQVMLAGACQRRRFLALVRDFILFEDDGSGALVKKMGGYHQFHAVEAAVAETLRAAEMQQARGLREETGHYEAGGKPGGDPGDRRIGVVWHTQGSGKSLTMAFYAGRIVREPAMENPTIVVLTDRNDLDDQLFATFTRCRDLLRQPPVQAKSRADLRARLAVGSGGVVFTTIQKFFLDEGGDQPAPGGARRAGRHPAAVRAAATSWSSPTRRIAASTTSSTASPATCAMLCRAPRSSASPARRSSVSRRQHPRRVWRLHQHLRHPARGGGRRHGADLLREPAGEAWRSTKASGPTSTPASRRRPRARSSTARRGSRPSGRSSKPSSGRRSGWPSSPEDIIDHFERRLEAMDGKAMVVCMSRRICIDLYRELVRLRPEWAHADDDKGRIKVVMTGSAADPPDWQPHIRNTPRREAMAKRFRDPDDPLRIVLVRDMWLTGFDAPSLHTMYVDKPMRGHGLMQAIARVNRVFRDKPGGLVVDYLGLAHELKRALAAYTESGGRGKTALDQAEAVAVMREKYEVCCGLFHGFDYASWIDGTPAARLALLPAAQEHILAQEDGKDRCLGAVRELSQAFALAVPHDEAIRIRDDVAFFQAVRAVLAKRAEDKTRPEEDLDIAIRQIVSKAVASEGVVDIFAAAGLDKPDISILSEEFLAEVQGMPHPNLAVELLQKLLKGELARRRRKNVVQARSFAEMLEQTLRRYQNRAVEAAQVIEELIELARDLREANARGETLGLSEDELAFYDALETNDSAVQVLGDETLRDIARELVVTVRGNVTIDWTLRENVRANLRRLVRRILRKHSYPPDKQEKATRTVLEQAEVLSAEWAA